MTDNINQKKNESKVYTLYYAFFLIPLMITIVGVMFFFMFKVLTYETNSPVDYLTDVQYGAAGKGKVEFQTTVLNLGARVATVKVIARDSKGRLVAQGTVTKYGKFKRL